MPRRTRLGVHRLEDRVTPVLGLFTEDFLYDPIPTYFGFDGFDDDPGTSLVDAFWVRSNIGVVSSPQFAPFPAGAYPDQPHGFARFTAAGTGPIPLTAASLDVSNQGTVPATFWFPAAGEPGGPGVGEAVGEVTLAVRFTGRVTFEGSGGSLTVPFSSEEWTTVSARYDAPTGPNQYLGEIRRVFVTADAGSTGDNIRINRLTATVIRADTGVPNSPPVATDDTVLIDRTTGVGAFDPRDNDSDPDGNALTFEVVTPPAYGTTDGLSYTLDPAYRNSPTVTRDRFTYRLTDSRGATAVTLGVVTIDINARPSGRADTYPVAHGTIGEFRMGDPARGVLANDHDPDGGRLTVRLASPPRFGSVVLGSDGTFVYTSTRPGGVVGEDAFEYTLSDGVWAVGPVRVRLAGPPNAAPVATGKIIAADHGAAAPFQLLLAATDPDGDALRWELVDGPKHGTIASPEAVAGGFRAFYTPTNTAKLIGSDRFTYRVSDGLASSTTVEVVISVPNHAPTALPDRFYFPVAVQRFVNGERLFVPTANRDALFSVNYNVLTNSVDWSSNPNLPSGLDSVLDEVPRPTYVFTPFTLLGTTTPAPATWTATRFTRFSPPTNTRPGPGSTTPGRGTAGSPGSARTDRSGTRTGRISASRTWTECRSRTRKRRSRFPSAGTR